MCGSDEYAYGNECRSCPADATKSSTDGEQCVCSTAGKYFDVAANLCIQCALGAYPVLNGCECSAIHEIWDTTNVCVHHCADGYYLDSGNEC